MFHDKHVGRLHPSIRGPVSPTSRMKCLVASHPLSLFPPSLSSLSHTSTILYSCRRTNESSSPLVLLQKRAMLLLHGAHQGQCCMVTSGAVLLGGLSRGRSLPGHHAAAVWGSPVAPAGTKLGAALRNTADLACDGRD